MGDLREYMYVTNGVETTAMLTAEHAAQLGAVPVVDGIAAKSRPVVANKARTVEDKGR